MKALFFSAVLLLLYSAASSQVRRTVDAFQMRGNLYPVGLDIEFADSDNKTINVEVGIMGNLASTSNSNQSNNLSFGFAPFADVQYRWFYKLKYEAKKGTKLIGNSGNFLALRVTAKSEPVLDLVGQAKSRFYSGAVWGLQRQYAHGFHLGFEIGIGYGMDSDFNTGFVPLGNLKAGWLLYHFN